MSGIAILSPGPSLREYAGTHDLRIGVNRAVEAVACDWWCFGDYEAVGWYAPKGEPRWFTNENTCRKLGVERTPLWGDFGLTSNTYSTVASLALAISLGPTIVEFFGADMRGAADWDGQVPERHNRDSERWARETIALDRMKARAVEAGIEIIHNRAVAA